MDANRTVPPGPGRSPRPGRTPATLTARKAGAGQTDAGEVTYTVRDAPRPASTEAERRSGPRQRTRLRSGKVLDADGRFLTECVFTDLSPRGSRIRPPAGTVLPDELYLYDDATGLLHRAAVLWRRGAELGLRFRPQVLSARTGRLAADMRRRFYAMAR